MMRVLERNASDGVNPIILIQFESLYLTRLIITSFTQHYLEEVGHVIELLSNAHSLWRQYI